MPLSLTELAKKYADLREEKRKMAIREKEINEEAQQIEQEIIPILENMGAQNINLEGIGTVYLIAKSYVRVLPERYDDFIKWLDERGLGALAKRQVNAQTLKSQYNEWESTDQPLPPEDVVSAYRKTEVGLRA